ncbi:MAG: hypothetical protein A4E31_00581 [Methanomassiliicoccales archaeon PtaU1.Bin030]|nr:MAG: hypothetical protein A4E31_00581 [Methanomassiliicoccales archaeon PtaU1.Bin030]
MRKGGVLIEDVRRAVEESVSRSGLKGRQREMGWDIVRDEKNSFEERFYDPDHPKDSDWVADFELDVLFSHLMGRRFPENTVRCLHFHSA